MIKRDNNKKQSYSFEIFPPKKTSNFSSVADVITNLCELQPSYISVTYGAGGSIRNNHTVELCKMIKSVSDIPPVAHLTCVGANYSDIDEILEQLELNGIKNVLALRGDLPQEGKVEGDFLYASELVKYINIKYPNEFNISCACYPTGHIESPTQKDDIFNLRNKVNQGAKELITQMFFDNNEFYKFYELCDIAQINVPISAGIMPLTNIRQINRIISMSGATLPSTLNKSIAKYGENDHAMMDAGIAFATQQIIDLLANGVDGIHLYTMNNVEVAKRITENVKSLF
ncbi:MAG: methylenetetrahydrofolate reductase [NAD(P)H] [Clostridia bacterium]